jgi:hypothetical protein
MSHRGFEVGAAPAKAGGQLDQSLAEVAPGHVVCAAQHPAETLSTFAWRASVQGSRSSARIHFLEEEPIGSMASPDGQSNEFLSASFRAWRRSYLALLQRVPRFMSVCALVDRSTNDPCSPPGSPGSQIARYGSRSSRWSSSAELG